MYYVPNTYKTPYSLSLINYAVWLEPISAARPTIPLKLVKHEFLINRPSPVMAREAMKPNVYVLGLEGPLNRELKKKMKFYCLVSTENNSLQKQPLTEKFFFVWYLHTMRSFYIFLDYSNYYR